MFRFRYSRAFAVVGIAALAVIACDPSEEADCDKYDDQQEYERCLEDVENLQKERTATAAANEIIDATAQAEAVIEFETAEALSDEDYEATTVALDATEEAGGEAQVLKRASSSTGLVDVATKADVEPTPVPAPTPEPHPTAVLPSPTSLPAPTPTAEPAAEVIDLSSLTWLTAFQAAEVAKELAPGEVFEIAGHASRAAGVLVAGDVAGSEPSPGAGYSREWSVTLQTDTETYFCNVGPGLNSCNSAAFHYGNGEVESVSEDSTEALARLNSEGNADWEALMANEDISILLDLHPDLSSASNLPPGATLDRIWSANVTVHNSTDGPVSGSFHWNVDRDEITWSVF